MKKPIIGLVGIALALSAAACGGDDGGEAQVSKSGPLVIDGVQITDEKTWQAAQDEGGLTLYTALGEDRENAMVDRFREATGLDVDVVRLPGSELFERISSEFGADHLQADVIRQSDYTLALEEDKAGVFKTYCPPNLEKIEKNLRPKGCNFYASQTPIYAIGYNNQQIDEADAPKSWKDLLDPQWKGKLGLANIGAGGSTWARDLFLEQKYGKDYWRQLAAQDATITEGAETVTEEMARGEVQLGMVLPGNQSLSASEGAPLSLVIPTDGVPAYGQWFGLSVAAKHPNAAKTFIDWQMSMPGQEAVAREAGDYPVVPGAPGPDFNGTELPTREEVKPVQMETDPEYISKREDSMNEWFSIFGYAPTTE